MTSCEDVKSARNRAGLSDRSAGVLKTGVIPDFSSPLRSSSENDIIAKSFHRKRL